MFLGGLFAAQSQFLEDRAPYFYKGKIAKCPRIISVLCLNWRIGVCVSCPPFFEAPRFALRGGLGYVSPAPPTAAPKDLVGIYSCGSTWGDLFRGPPVPS